MGVMKQIVDIKEIEVGDVLSLHNCDIVVINILNRDYAKVQWSDDDIISETRIINGTSPVYLKEKCIIKSMSSRSLSKLLNEVYMKEIKKNGLCKQ